MAATVVHTLWIKIAAVCGRSIVGLCLPSVENLLRRAFPGLHRNRETSITKLLSCDNTYSVP